MKNMEKKAKITMIVSIIVVVVCFFLSFNFTNGVSNSTGEPYVSDIYLNSSHLDLEVGQEGDVRADIFYGNVTSDNVGIIDVSRDVNWSSTNEFVVEILNVYEEDGNSSGIFSSRIKIRAVGEGTSNIYCIARNGRQAVLSVSVSGSTLANFVYSLEIDPSTWEGFEISSSGDNVEDEKTCVNNLTSQFLRSSDTYKVYCTDGYKYEYDVYGNPLPIEDYSSSQISVIFYLLGGNVLGDVKQDILTLFAGVPSDDIQISNNAGLYTISSTSSSDQMVIDYRNSQFGGYEYTNGVETMRLARLTGSISAPDWFDINDFAA